MADPQHRRLTGVSLEGDVKWGQSGGVLPFGPRDQQNRGFHKGNSNAEIWIQVCACACACVRMCVCARVLLSCLGVSRFVLWHALDDMHARAGACTCCTWPVTLFQEQDWKAFVNKIEAIDNKVISA